MRDILYNLVDITCLCLYKKGKNSNVAKLNILYIYLALSEIT